MSMLLTKYVGDTFVIMVTALNVFVTNIWYLHTNVLHRFQNITNKMSPVFLLATFLGKQPIKALFGLVEDYPNIGGLKRAIVRRRIRLLKMRLKFCTGQTCQKCAKVLAKNYDTPKKVFYRSRNIFKCKSFIWNSSGKASHYVGFICDGFHRRILNGTSGS